jgi:hypothetical protein
MNGIISEQVREGKRLVAEVPRPRESREVHINRADFVCRSSVHSSHDLLPPKSAEV